jgi:CRP-like cAMP-binding protein
MHVPVLRSSFALAGESSTPARYERHETIFRQGDPGNSIFRIQSGLVKLTTITNRGREAVIAILRSGDFIGEGCLLTRVARNYTASALTECWLQRFSREAMLRLLRNDANFSAEFTERLLARNRRYEEDLSDQLSNSSEKRLARTLLLLADGRTGSAQLHIDQQTLAEMVGTTRSRICFFMNKFRRMGLIDYSNGLEVRRGLEQVVLGD